MEFESLLEWNYFSIAGKNIQQLDMIKITRTFPKYHLKKSSQKVENTRYD